MSGFEGIIGHHNVVELLTVEATNPTHAYLFVGPSSVGKAAVARRFAALLLCGDDAQCRRRVLADVHPDLMSVEPDGRTALGVERARETVARAVLTPVEADHKVFLFEEAGAMNEEAANALLKTLEEPTASTIFILIAESEDDLPSTVSSRSRTILFGRVSEDEIVAALVERGIADDQARAPRLPLAGVPGWRFCSPLALKWPRFALPGSRCPPASRRNRATPSASPKQWSLRPIRSSPGSPSARSASSHLLTTKEETCGSSRIVTSGTGVGRRRHFISPVSKSLPPGIATPPWLRSAVPCATATYPEPT